MSTIENKALVRRYYEVGVQNPAIFDEVPSPGYVLHFPGTPMPIQGITTAKDLHATYLAAFPDVQTTIEDMVAEGDRIAVRLTHRGTHRGIFQGLPATGKQVTTTSIIVDRVVDGKIVEEWVQMDALGMMQQLGVVPAPGQAHQS